MPNLTVSPQSALLTVGQPITFTATTADSQPIDKITWALNPATMGTLVPSGTPDSPQGPSVTYVAPPTIAASQSVAIVATAGTETASATVALTPDSVAVIPDAASIVAGEIQRFVAVVASPEPENVTWILTPPLGDLTRDEKTGEGVYKPPDPVPDNCTVKVIAADRFGRRASATVTLATKPWRGFGVYLLGIYLFFVFSLVVFLVGLVPARVSNVQDLKADKAQADAALQKLLTQKAEVKSSPAPNPGSPPANNSPTKTQANPGPTKTQTQTPPPAPPIPPDLQTQIDQATKDLNDKDTALKEATGLNVNTILLHNNLNREVDLMLLVLLSGALGSFLHMAQSFSSFTGNRTLKSSWVWWYALRPFVGAALALVIYAAIRGGLISVGAGTGFDSTGLNPYGLMAGAALAGLFSKDATQKLGEIFANIFNSEKATQTKDKLLPPTQTQAPAQKPATDSAAGNPAPVR
jgi:hypothetical protein